jgi:hypothetical protein
LVQTNGVGFLFLSLVHLRISVSSAPLLLVVSVVRIKREIHGDASLFLVPRK